MLSLAEVWVRLTSENVPLHERTEGPVSNCSRSAASASAEGYRRAGSRAIDRAMIASRAAGRSG